MREIYGPMSGEICWATCFRSYSPKIRLRKDKFSKLHFKKLSWALWCMVPEISSVTNNFFVSFWTIFCPFNPLKTPKIKVLEEWKKFLEISFYIGVSKIKKIICYTVSEIWYVTDIITIFHFGFFLPFYPTNSLKNQN